MDRKDAGPLIVGGEGVPKAKYARRVLGNRALRVVLDSITFWVSFAILCDLRSASDRSAFLGLSRGDFHTTLGVETKARVLRGDS